VLSDARAALGITALIAAMPELMLTVCRIGNDALAVVAGTLCVFLAFRTRDPRQRTRYAVLLGIATGLALLTKAYFLALIPPLVLLPLFVWRKRTLIPSLALAAGPLAIAAWWYARNLLSTGSLSGEQTELAAHRFTTPELLEMIPRVPWLNAADFIFLSHIWLGDWSFLVVRSWMYHVFALVWIIAAIGVAWKRRTGLLSAFYLSFLLAMAYHVLITYSHSGIAGTLGFYLYSMVVAESILLYVGLSRIGIAALTIAFAALESFALLFYMLPYYTGLIAHLPNGNLPAYHLAQFSSLLTRLSTNKPGFLPIPTIAVLFLLSTLLLLTLATVVGRPPRAARAPLGPPAPD
jgi:4-amino-4-deoxy-L-arabinose transferase-like glycosyltransferase